MYDPQRQAFGNRSLTHTRLTDQHRVVLGPAAQHLHRAADFLIPANDRVDLALFGPRGQVEAVFLQSLIAVFGGGAVGLAPLAHIIDRGVQGLGRYFARFQRRLRARLHHAKRGQNAFDSNETIARFLGHGFGLSQYFGGGAVQIDLPRIAGDFRDFAKCEVKRLHHARTIAARGRDQVARQPLVVVQQCFEYMFRGQPLMAFPCRNGLRRLNKAARSFRELAQVHGSLLFYKRSKMPRPICGTQRSEPRYQFGKRCCGFKTVWAQNTALKEAANRKNSANKAKIRQLCVKKYHPMPLI